MKKKMTQLVQTLKAEGEDHEFYPTTDEILSAMHKDLIAVNNKYGFEIKSVLDIGAGNGKVLKSFVSESERSPDLYAIEKSLMLCKDLVKFCFVVGTDLLSQNLMMKDVTLVFSNPPYSVYEDWAEKIIREACSNVVYLVIPERWQQSERIRQAMKYRGADHKIVGAFDFMEADRPARAKVSLIRIVLHAGGYRNENDDPFTRFFNEQFSDLRKRFEESEPPKEGAEKREDPRLKAIIGRKDYPKALVDLYEQEIVMIQKNYDAVGLLDADLLREFNVNPDSIMKCLKRRLCDLRMKYWRELFNQLKPITNRLVKSRRSSMIETLRNHGHVDFTEDNIQAVVLWVLQNAANDVDKQLCELFDSLVDRANVKNYKSNERVFVYDQWRYNEDKSTHIALEYRLVLQHSGGIRRTEFQFDKGLEERAAELLGDILTVAYNLGFNCDTADVRLWRRDQWGSGDLFIFPFTENGKEESLFEVRAFFNGNMHIRLNQKFALALNVENGRLRGWLKDPSHAAVELDDLGAIEIFGSHICLGPRNLPLLTTG